MALKVGELYATLKLEAGQFKQELAESGKRFASFEGASKGLGSTISGMLVGGGLVAFGRSALVAAGSLEQAQIAFSTMLGSAQQAESFLGELRDFARVTPFELPGLVDASRKLLAFGFSAKDIIPMMTSLGDAVSALGGGEEEIHRVTLALGQMKAKGKVSAEEMMQLAELGIPAWEMLAHAIGTDIPTAMKRSQAGMINARVGIQAILSGMHERFAGSMEKQSQTLMGLWSTFKDTAGQTLAELGKAFLKTSEDLLKTGTTVVGTVTSLVKVFNLLPEGTRSWIITIGGMVGGLALLLKLIPAVKLAVTGCAVAIGGWGTAILAAAIVIGGLAAKLTGGWAAIQQWIDSLGSLREKQDEMKASGMPTMESAAAGMDVGKEYASYQKGNRKALSVQALKNIRAEQQRQYKRWASAGYPTAAQYEASRIPGAEAARGTGKPSTSRIDELIKESKKQTQALQKLAPIRTPVGS